MTSLHVLSKFPLNSNYVNAIDVISFVNKREFMEKLNSEDCVKLNTEAYIGGVRTKHLN